MLSILVDGLILGVFLYGFGKAGAEDWPIAIAHILVITVINGILSAVLGGAPLLVLSATLTADLAYLILMCYLPLHQAAIVMGVLLGWKILWHLLISALLSSG